MLEVDLAIFVTPLITAVIAVVGVYVAVVSRLTATETLITELRKSVEKHNSIVERTYKLESDQATCWKRIDDLRSDLHDMKVEVRDLKKGGDADGY